MPYDVQVKRPARAALGTVRHDEHGAIRGSREHARDIVVILGCGYVTTNDNNVRAQLSSNVDDHPHLLTLRDRVACLDKDARLPSRMLPPRE